MTQKLASYLADEQCGNLFLLGEQRQVMAHQQHLVRYEHVGELIRLFIHRRACGRRLRAN